MHFGALAWYFMAGSRSTDGWCSAIAASGVAAHAGILAKHPNPAETCPVALAIDSVVQHPTA